MADTFLYLTLGTNNLERAARFYDAALAPLAIPAAAVVARPCYQGYAPAALGPRQQANDRVVDCFQRAGKAQRPDGLQRRRSLAGPVIASHAEARARDLGAPDAGIGQRLIGDRLQRRGQTSVADDLMVARPAQAKAHGAAVLICQ